MAINTTKKGERHFLPTDKSGASVAQIGGELNIGISVLSLFDGMSCGQIAFRQLGVEVDRYISYEIDKYAISVTQLNFPNTEQCGDVFAADFTQYRNIDWLIGGSPCTHWSIAQKNNRETQPNSGMGWELFSQYVRAVKEAKPKYFLYENNQSMSKAIRAAIDEAFGFEAVEINSALVSAQNRRRLYWVGQRNTDGSYSRVQIALPADRGITLRDILDSAQGDKTYRLKPLSDREMSYMVRVTSNGRNHFDFAHHQDATRDKAVCLTANVSKGVPYNVCCEPVRIGTIENSLKKPDHDSKQYRVYSPDGKSTTLCGQGGGVGAKTGLYAVPVYQKHDIGPIYTVFNGYILIDGDWHHINLPDGYYIIRKLSVNECKRLQTVPDWYDMSVLSDAQTYKCLGNGWTVEVIMHILQSAITS